MKNLLPFALMTLATTTGCSSLSSHDEVRSFIPGIYVRTVTNEFSRGSDTLFIGVLSSQGNSFRIIKKAGYQRIKAGKPLDRESKTETWTAVYNEQEKMLHETVKGKLISFNPEGRSLMVGSSEYRKIE